MNPAPAIGVQNTLEKLFSFLVSKNEKSPPHLHLVPDPDIGFLKNPFHELCDPELFYDGGQHARIYQSLQQFVGAHLSLGTLTGEVGLGKTMLQRTLANHIDPQQYCISQVIALSKMSPGALLKAILHGFGYRIQIIEKRHAVADLFKVLEDFSERLQACHKHLLIFIDEAHLLSPEALKLVKSITCLESTQQKLASVILFGEPSLDSRIEHEVFESLKSRIYLAEKLVPLCEGEIRQYINHRLRCAGYSSNLFHGEEINQLVLNGRGNCREINKLAFALFKGKSYDELTRSSREH